MLKIKQWHCAWLLLGLGLLTACELPQPDEETHLKHKPAVVKGVKAQNILTASSAPPSLPPGESALPSAEIPSIPPLSSAGAEIPHKIKVTPLKPASARASSELDDPRYGRFGASNVIDGNPHTCWQEFKDDTGEGEWLELKLKKPEKISKIGIVNGFAWPDHPKWGNVFHKNPRLKEVKLSFSDGSTQTVSFDDSHRPQVVNIDEVLTSTVRLTIRSVYPGSEWKDTSLSEVQLYAATYVAVPATPASSKSPAPSPPKKP